MSNTIKGRSYNIRVSFDEAGEPCIGFVRGFYKASEAAHKAYQQTKLKQLDVVIEQYSLEPWLAAGC